MFFFFFLIAFANTFTLTLSLNVISIIPGNLQISKNKIADSACSGVNGGHR